MRTNYTNEDLPPSMRNLGNNEIHPDFKHLRRSVRIVLEACQIDSKKGLKTLTPAEIEQIRDVVDFFRKNPGIADADIEKAFRERAVVHNSIADAISKEGRAVLEDLYTRLPKQSVN
jgi:tryptophan 2,3-dioxygenase